MDPIEENTGWAKTGSKTALNDPQHDRMNTNTETSGIACLDTPANNTQEIQTKVKGKGMSKIKNSISGPPCFDPALAPPGHPSHFASGRGGHSAVPRG